MNSSSSSSTSSSSDEEVFLRRRKIYQERKDYFHIYDDLDFFHRFRLTKPTFTRLMNRVEDDIRLPTNRGGCIQPVIQLLLTLRFLASGNMLLAVGDFVGVSKSSASRIVKRVCEAIANLYHEYIKMPETANEMEQTAMEFYRIARIPRTIGAIDGSLFEIISPGGEDAEIFRCRKGFFAINVQIVSVAKLRFRSIVARWPGSVHDQTVFNNSRLKTQLEGGRYGQYHLVGDSGYHVERYLMTKLIHVQKICIMNRSFVQEMLWKGNLAFGKGDFPFYHKEYV